MSVFGAIKLVHCSHLQPATCPTVAEVIKSMIYGNKISSCSAYIPFPAQNINGMVFTLIPEDKWEELLSIGGQYTLKNLMQQVCDTKVLCQIIVVRSHPSEHVLPWYQRSGGICCVKDHTISTKMKHPFYLRICQFCPWFQSPPDHPGYGQKLASELSERVSHAQEMKLVYSDAYIKRKVCMCLLIAYALNSFCVETAMTGVDLLLEEDIGPWWSWREHKVSREWGEKEGKAGIRGTELEEKPKLPGRRNESIHALTLITHALISFCVETIVLNFKVLYWSWTMYSAWRRLWTLLCLTERKNA